MQPQRQARCSSTPSSSTATASRSAPGRPACWRSSSSAAATPWSPTWPPWASSTPAFDFTGGIGDRIREDYNQTLSDLFRDNHLLPLKTYAAGYGMTVRGQAYSSWGPSPDRPSDMATLLDTPEGEDLSFNEGSTSPAVSWHSPPAAPTSGARWPAPPPRPAATSSPLSAAPCSATTRVPRQKLLTHVNQQFSVGVNHIVWHGWADQSPGAASNWPGFSPFGAFISDVYGPQNPTFADDKAINTYVGRMQTILRRGHLRNDVAIYRDDAGHSPDGSTGHLYFTDQSLARAGYTYGFLNDTLVPHRRRPYPAAG